MSIETAEKTRKAFAAKGKKAEAAAVSDFKTIARADGTPAHNLEYMRGADGYLYLRINLSGSTVPSSKGNPLVSTSRGFVMLDNIINISVNALPAKK